MGVTFTKTLKKEFKELFSLGGPVKVIFNFLDATGFFNALEHVWFNVWRIYGRLFDLLIGLPWGWLITLDEHMGNKLDIIATAIAVLWEAGAFHQQETAEWTIAALAGAVILHEMFHNYTPIIRYDGHDDTLSLNSLLGYDVGGHTTWGNTVIYSGPFRMFWPSLDSVAIFAWTLLWMPLAAATRVWLAHVFFHGVSRPMWRDSVGNSHYTLVRPKDDMVGDPSKIEMRPIWWTILNPGTGDRVTVREVVPAEVI